ncbi:AaceriAEL277Cp [[Ashbya] aceris (nom. inval.)]|nr:AaceriAEL277Cp [[Ashbya] aceris (nom. inval.)]
MAMESECNVVELIGGFFLKATLLVCQPRTGAIEGEVEEDRTFNISSAADAGVAEAVRAWTAYDGARELPPLVIEMFLDLRRLGPQHTVVLKDQDGNPWNVCKGGKKSEIMLERWLVELDVGSEESRPEEPPSAAEIYKQLVLLFRYLYTLTQLLPANELYARLHGPSSQGEVMPLINIGTRILDGSKPILSKGRVGLSRSIIATYTNVINETNVASHLEQKKITPISTGYGSLRITVSYRRDCNFHVNEVDYEGNNCSSSSVVDQTKPGVGPLSSLRRVSIHSNRSMSISPQTVYSGTVIPDPSPQRKSSSSRIQPFKAGSVGSGSLAIARNPSGSSAVATLRAQRSGSASISTHVADQAVGEPSSVGSGGSKYSSSFGKIRRQSSMRRSGSLELPVAKQAKPGERGSDELLDFVKMLEDKQELNVKKLYGTTTDISSSLVRFQSMKSNNDTLSEDLSMSYSLEPTHGPQVRYRSNSHSPIPSISPSVQYTSIPMRLSQSRNVSQTELASRKNSAERLKTLISSRTGSFSESRRQSNAGQEDILEDEDDEAEEILLSKSHLSNPAGTRLQSMSPQSLKSISSYNRAAVPFKPVSNFSCPTTMATPAHAKLHKASISSSPDNQSGLAKKDHEHSTMTGGDDDDDLLFFMSDMNLSSQ